MNRPFSNLAQQSGNILFLILLAVVLFAALSYAVTQSLRGGGKDAGAENAQTVAAAFVQFGMDVGTFITRAQLTDNVKDTEFTFQVNSNSASTQNFLFTDGTADGWFNNSNCTRAACRVFKPYNPDGIAAQTFEKYADPLYLTNSNQNMVKGGHPSFRQVILQNVGTDAPDLVLIIYGVSANVCNAINRQVGLSTSYTNTTSITDIGEPTNTSSPGNLSVAYSGPTVFDTTRRFGDEATQFAGMRTFCAPFLQSGVGVGSRLAFVHVILER